MMKKITSILILFLITSFGLTNANEIQPAAMNYPAYVNLIHNKRVAIFANNASQVNGVNIVKFLLQRNINIIKIFSPEHGFSGNADAGAKVANDKLNNISVISLYGNKEQPSKQDLANVDIIIFDIQDVGVRYYTYISSLQKLMEAATYNNKPIIILDRPNPNANYIDGPILESNYHSFVGMQAVPIVYGMTIGEYAKMLVGEQWLNLKPKSLAQHLDLTIIPIQNYTHNSYYHIPVKPSPNLLNMNSILWYPSLGWFEGTKLSVGRGTDAPFQVLGSDKIAGEYFSFTPHATLGALHPPLENKLCYGWNLQMSESQATAQINKQIQLSLLINSYHSYNDKANFFTPFFDKLAGNSQLRQQIINNINESEIRKSWESGITQFKKIRAKYLIYPES